MLGLWSAKGQRTRALHVPVPADTGSLGLALQWTSLSLASNIWHVLEVPAHSPADVAGLLPFSDYILGTPEGVLHGESGLGELVEDYIGRPLRLWVYNNEYDVTREVAIQPSRDWGGQGALGCVLGYGVLHRLPAPLSEPVHAPGETLFEADNDKVASGFPHAAAPPTTFTPPPPVSGGGEFFVPAQMAETGPPAGSAPPKAGKKKDRHAHNANPLMDDYFKEQEQKSRELDGTTGPKASPLPPPPKGGPPRTETPPEEAPSTTATEGDAGVD